MKHYTKQELENKVKEVAHTVANELGDFGQALDVTQKGAIDSIINAFCAIYNPPEREPSAIEEKIMNWIDSHEQEEAILELAKEKGVLGEVAVGAGEAPKEDVAPVDKESKAKASNSKRDIKDCRQYEKGKCLLYGHECQGLKTCDGDFVDTKSIEELANELVDAATHKKTAKSKKTQPDAPKTSTADKGKKTQKRAKTSNFDNVDTGVCPHCQEKTLEKDVAGKGDGVTRMCKKCQHKWYINRKIHTCKCLSEHKS